MYCWAENLTYIAIAGFELGLVFQNLFRTMQMLYVYM